MVLEIERTPSEAIVWIVNGDKSYDLRHFSIRQYVHYLDYAKSYAANVANVIGCEVKIQEG